MLNTKLPEIIGESNLPVFEFGLHSVEAIPFDRLNVLTQTRKSYSEESLEELTRSIESVDAEGNPRNVLLHPPLVNVLDKSEAETYVAELNLCHKTSHSLDDTVPLDDGRYAIVIAGHRRRLAIGRILDKRNADPALSTVNSNVVHNLNFSEALRLQMEENTHLQLPIHELARAIQATYRYGVETGNFTSIADCVRALPYSEEKVRNAIRFCELPEFIQEVVEDRYMSYSAAVALYPAMQGLLIRYADEPNVETIVQDSLFTWTARIIENGWGKDMVAAQVAATLASWAQDYHFQLKLIEFDEAKIARQQRQKAIRSLSKDGISRLRAYIALVASTGESPDQLDEVSLELKEIGRELGSLAIRDSEIQPLFN